MALIGRDDRGKREIENERDGKRDQTLFLLTKVIRMEMTIAAIQRRICAPTIRISEVVF
jgi:hypothetical protein